MLYEANANVRFGTDAESSEEAVECQIALGVPKRVSLTTAVELGSDILRANNRFPFG